MDLSTVDFSMWPPAAVWAVVVIWILCGPLPDAIEGSWSKRQHPES